MRNYESDAYRKYQSSIEQRQKVVRTSGSPYSQQTAVQGKTANSGKVCEYKT